MEIINIINNKNKEMNFKMYMFKASILLLLNVCLATNLPNFQLYDSTGDLNQVRNGLYVHVLASIVNGSTEDAIPSPYLLCTSCTISYIFSEKPAGTPASTV